MIDDFSAPARRKPKQIQAPDKTTIHQPRVVYTEAAHGSSNLNSLAEIITTDTSDPESEIGQSTPNDTAQKSAKKHRFWPLINWPPTKRQSIVLGLLAVLVVFGAGAAWTQIHRTVTVSAAKTVVHTPKKPVVATPTTVASTLTGLQVDPTVNQRPVTGVMIENSIDARPQSGLDQAGVVFEAIAEGGITRFLALYQDTQPDYLGPVRSARPYYVQWCMGFDCSLAHVGGSPEALTDIPAWGTKNLDQFANSGAYERISTRYAPHNVYTSMAQLNQLETSKGYGASTFTGFARKVDKPKTQTAASSSTSKAKTAPAPDNRASATSIDMAISGYDYNTHYDYDATTNSYKRSEGGAPHMSLHKDGSQVQITPKVVIAMMMQYGLEADDHHSQYNVVGSGQAYIFQDGTVVSATWSKADTKSPLTFKDAAGKDVQLDAGQTWLTALSANNQLSYK